MLRTIVFTFSSCCCFCGPSSRTSCQWDGIEVLDRGERQTLGFDGLAEIRQLLDGPELILILDDAPALPVALRLGDARTAVEVVDPVGDDVGRSRLPGEAEVLRRQHVAIES